MGCNVGADPDGRDFVGRLARLLGVPVQAAIPIQYAADASEGEVSAAVNFLMEGDVVRGSPTPDPSAR